MENSGNSELKLIGKIAKTERLELKVWIANKANNLKVRARELEAEAENL